MNSIAIIVLQEKLDVMIMEIKKKKREHDEVLVCPLLLFILVLAIRCVFAGRKNCQRSCS